MIKWFILIPILMLSLLGCSTFQDNSGELAFKDRYIPMLKVYIQKDATMDEGLKGVHLLVLDEWYKHERD